MITHEIHHPLYERVDDRGIFREVVNGFNFEALIVGTLNPGAILGNHYHKKTTLFFYLTSGSVNVKVIHVETGETDQFDLHANQGVFLRTYESHRILFCEKSDYIILKSLRYDAEDPDTFKYPVPD